MKEGTNMSNYTVDFNVAESIVSPSMESYGAMSDLICSSQYTFHSGKIYGIVGECGSGGWGISYILCGRGWPKECKIKINGKEVNQGELEKVGWYVGEGVRRRKHFFQEKSVKKQIEGGIRKSKVSSVEDVIRKFHLTPERLSVRLSVLSWERWRASAAIGYAHNCKIFCFPWLNTCYLNNMITNSRLDIFSDILKQEGNIIIIPTEKQGTIEMIADEIIEINNPRFGISSLAKEVIESYRKDGIPK